MTDSELVILSQQGDVRAFNRLAGRSNAALYGFVRRTLGNADDAQDVCQEAFIKAYANIGRLREPEKFGAWLHHIALNLCRDWHRAAKSRPAVQSLENDADGRAFEIPADDAADRAEPDRERAEMLDDAQRLLARISLEQRTAIVLREYQGFTSQEIAEITGVPPATVRTRVFYGLKAIHAMLHEQERAGMRREDARPEGGERR